MKTSAKQPQPVSHTIQSKTKAANQASIQTVLQKYRNNTIQLYSETLTDDPTYVSNMQANRNSIGYGFSISDCKKNFAYNRTSPAISCHSQENRHAEPGVIMNSKLDADGHIDVVSERQPCAYCEKDMRDCEVNLPAIIDVLYFVNHDENAAQNLHDLYS